jgi:hypothetical protein
MEYWREYARKNADKRAAIKKAWRERNKAQVAAYAKSYRAAHAGEERKPSKPRKRSMVGVTLAATIGTFEAKTEAFQTLRERFAAYRAARAEGRE